MSKNIVDINQYRLQKINEKVSAAKVDKDVVEASVGFLKVLSAAFVEQDLLTIQEIIDNYELELEIKISGDPDEDFISVSLDLFAGAYDNNGLPISGYYVGGDSMHGCFITLAKELDEFYNYIMSKQED